MADIRKIGNGFVDDSDRFRFADWASSQDVVATLDLTEPFDEVEDFDVAPYRHIFVG